jgi:2'-5' RNA ligase
LCWWNVSPEDGAEPINKSATARVFFALWPDPARALVLADLANAMASRFAGRSTRTDTVHLTLAFLGEVPETALPTLCAIAGGIKVPPFELLIDRLGYWPHNQLLWAGCSTSPAALLELVNSLQQNLGAAGFAPDRAERHFTPHISLLRKVPRIFAPGSADPLPKIQPLPWHCSRWVQTTRSWPSFCWLDRDERCGRSQTRRRQNPARVYEQM